jgi:hypothetical protein
MLISRSFSDSLACGFPYYPVVPPTEINRKTPPLLPLHNASNNVDDNNNTTLDGLSQSQENDFVIGKSFLKEHVIPFIQDSPCGTSKVLFNFFLPWRLTGHSSQKFSSPISTIYAQISYITDSSKPLIVGYIFKTWAKPQTPRQL